MFVIMAKINVTMAILFVVIGLFGTKENGELPTQTVIMALPVVAVWFVSSCYILFSTGVVV